VQWPTRPSVRCRPSKDSYLREDRIISAAGITNVDAIQFRYGFLSERKGFAEKCAAANIKFIGPRPETIGLMGDKANARQTAAAAKVPCVPGTDGPIDNQREAIEAAHENAKSVSR
jgi:acetyl-CoA carboxylase biotin carboxylase subunit